MTANQTAAPQVAVNTFQSSNTVDLVVLTGAGYSVKVTNLNGTAPIYFTVDSPGGHCTPPTVGGPTNFCVASVANGNINTRSGDFQFGAVVQLISPGTPQYMVELQSIRATS